MTDRDALIAAVCENPADDLPRLVYADWLDEHGEGLLAEFIRTQIQWEKGPPKPAPDESLGEGMSVLADWKRRREALARRIDEMLGHGEARQWKQLPWGQSSRSDLTRGFLTKFHLPFDAVRNAFHRPCGKCGHCRGGHSHGGRANTFIHGRLHKGNPNNHHHHCDKWCKNAPDCDECHGSGERPGDLVGMLLANPIERFTADLTEVRLVRNLSPIPTTTLVVIDPPADGRGWLAHIGPSDAEESGWDYTNEANDRFGIMHQIVGSLKARAGL